MEDPIKIKIDKDSTPNEELLKRARELVELYRKHIQKKAYPSLMQK